MRATESSWTASDAARAVQAFQTIEVIALAALVLLLYGGGIVGMKAFVVLSGSMEPAIPTGALAYVKGDIDCKDVAQGDVIAFSINDNMVVTHRVVENDTEAEQITTRGDANSAADGAPVKYAQVIGKTIAAIPCLGTLSVFIADNKLAVIAGLVVVNTLLAMMAKLSAKTEKSLKKRKRRA